MATVATVAAVGRRLQRHARRHRVEAIEVGLAARRLGRGGFLFDATYF